MKGAGFHGSQPAVAHVWSGVKAAHLLSVPTAAYWQPVKEPLKGVGFFIFIFFVRR